MQPRSKVVATIGAVILIGIILVASVQAAFAASAESPKESYMSNVNYAAGISMGMMAVSRAFTTGEPFSDDTFRQMLKTIITSEALMACRSVECRMQWGAKFAEAMAKKAMAKKANLPRGADLSLAEQSER
jgi:hypothetical protein